MERIALVQARINMNRAIRKHALAATTLGVKFRLTVQNTINRRSGILDEKPPKVVAQHSSLLSERHATVGHIRRLHPSTRRQGWKARQSA
jgi:hypothetical protein